MTDNEIIKALACCKVDNSLSDCQESKCPFSTKYGCKLYSGVKKIDDRLYRLAYDIINRQKVEIENLKKGHYTDFEKWQRLSEKTEKHYAELYEEAVAITRIEAVKKFAERLKEKSLKWGYDKVVYCDDIEALLKEMVGEGND